MLLLFNLTPLQKNTPHAVVLSYSMDSLEVYHFKRQTDVQPLYWAASPGESLINVLLFSLPCLAWGKKRTGVKISFYVLSSSVSDTQFKRSIFSNALSLLSFKKYSDTRVVYLISLNLQKCLSTNTLVVLYFLTLK